MMLDVSYIGNQGSRLNHHAQRAGLDYNMNDPARPGAGRRAPECEHQLARRPGGRDHASLPGLQRNRGAGAAEVSPVPEHRLARSPPGPEPVPRPRGRPRAAASRSGLQYRVGYTYSRLKNNGAESGAGQRRASTAASRIPSTGTTADYGLSQDDTPHVFLVGFTWDIAHGAPRTGRGAKKALLGGWNLSGILRYESGRPLRITMANDMGGLLFNTQKRPNRTGARRRGRRAGISTRTPTTTSTRTPGRTRVRSRSATRREPTGRCADSRCSTRT